MKLLPLCQVILQLLATVWLSQQVCNREMVRLVDGFDRTEGRVELCINDQWGTVCDDEWDHEDANVVCHQLGFLNQGAKALRMAQFGEGNGPIYLDEVQCNGTEHSLLDCLHSGVLNHDCRHTEDAGVICKVSLTTCSTYTQTQVILVPTETNFLICSTTVQPVSNHCCTVSPAKTNTATMNYAETSNNCSTADPNGLNKTANSANTGALGAFLAILILIVICLSVGWILTCVFMRRKHLEKGKTNITNREDQVRALHNPIYTGAELQNESLPAEYSIPVPNYEVVSPTSENSLLPTTEQHAYDVISQQQRQVKVASQSDESEVYSQLQH